MEWGIKAMSIIMLQRAALLFSLVTSFSEKVINQIPMINVDRVKFSPGQHLFEDLHKIQSYLPHQHYKLPAV